MLEDENELESFTNSFTQQLQELELLQSMYPNPGEVVLTDPTIANDMSDFISTHEYLPPHLDYTVTISIGHLKVEICVHLPHAYPIEGPDILVRCNQLNRKQQTKLNMDMTDFIKSLENETCVYSIIMWLQENAENYCVELNALQQKEESTQVLNNEDIQYMRYWIYSHHIYNKRKREEILSNAKELKLTGFCLPGKPGIICIEGDESDCNEWWRIIKSLTWKKITLRKSEKLQSSRISHEKKFSKFEELHLDMGQLSKYLENHGLKGTLQELLGLSD